MTKVWDAASGRYIERSEKMVRTAVFMFIGYKIIQSFDKSQALRPATDLVSEVKLTHYSPVGAIGIQTVPVKNNQTIKGSIDDLIIRYKVTGGSATTNTVVRLNGVDFQTMVNPNGAEVTVTIPRTKVESEMGTTGDLQVEIQVLPAPEQSGFRYNSLKFRYARP
jgi:hypothetical protein